MYAIARNPAAPMTEGIATCRNRSPVRSELRLTSTMATAAAIYGIEVSVPTVNSEYPVSPLMMEGTQNDNP